MKNEKCKVKNAKGRIKLILCLDSAVKQQNDITYRL